MAGTELFPGSDATCMATIPNGTPTEITLKGEVKWVRNRPRAEPLEDTQTPAPKHRLRATQGQIMLTAMTDKELDFLHSMRGGTLQFTFLSGRVLTFGGVTETTDGGIEENVSTGETNELRFSYRTFSDKSPPT